MGPATGDPDSERASRAFPNAAPGDDFAASAARPIPATFHRTLFPTSMRPPAAGARPARTGPRRARGCSINRSLRLLLAALAAFSLVVAPIALAKERSEVPVQFTWDLSALYPSEAAWTAAREDLARRVPGIAAFQGHLGAAPESLYTALSTMMDLDRGLSRLQTYASQLNDEDQRVSRHLEMREAAQRLLVQLRAASSYVRPELLAMGGSKVSAYIAAEPRLKDYKPYLEDILRFEKHTL